MPVNIGKIKRLSSHLRINRSKTTLKYEGRGHNEQTYGRHLLPSRSFAQSKRRRFDRPVSREQ
jgi:hypothetical protein